MSKRVIVLGTTFDPVVSTINAVFWYPIASTPVPTVGSSLWALASVAEVTALQAGTVIEEGRSFQYPTGLSSVSIEAFLLQYWTNRNTQIAGTGLGTLVNVFNDSITNWSA